VIEIERPGFPWPLLKFWFWRSYPMWCAFALVLVMFLGTVTATWLYDFGQPVPLYRFFQTAINAGLSVTLFPER